MGWQKRESGFEGRPRRLSDDSSWRRALCSYALACLGALWGCGRAPATSNEPEWVADGQQAIEPVSHELLAELLVESIGSWARADQAGQAVELPHGRFSNVTATYASPEHANARMYVAITDGCGVGRMYQDYEVRRATDAQGADVRYTNLDVQGFPAVETISEPSLHAEMNVLVAQRFLVKVHSEQIGYETLRSFLTGLDLKRLASFE